MDIVLIYIMGFLYFFNCYRNVFRLGVNEMCFVRCINFIEFLILLFRGGVG